MTEPKTATSDQSADKVVEAKRDAQAVQEPVKRRKVYQLPLLVYSEPRGADLFPGFSRLFK